MRNLGQTWAVKVRYWYQQKDHIGSFRDSGLMTETFIIEADTYSIAAENVLSFIGKKYSDEKEYRSVHIEAYSISEYEVPSNFLVKEY